MSPVRQDNWGWDRAVVEAMRKETERGAPSGVAPEFLNEAGMGGGLGGVGGGGGGCVAVPLWYRQKNCRPAR